MAGLSVFRLFVSSTFADFVEERKALQEIVFPELEGFCQQRGASFQAVDLRWGITEEAQCQHDTMRICLEEVRRCQALSPKPNFAVLLGERYGWEPPPARIHLAHWERLIAAASAHERRIIEDGYTGPDFNSLSPVYYLRTFESSSRYQRESEVRDALREAADAAGFRGVERVSYFASATHQEIMIGALSGVQSRSPELHPDKHVHVYARTIDGLPDEVSARPFVDWEGDQALFGARVRLGSLKAELKALLPNNFHEFRARWTGAGTDGSHIKPFCEKFLQDQKETIERVLAGRRQPVRADWLIEQHAAFAGERAMHFTGRGECLARASHYLGLERAGIPLFFVGDGGIGKSALLARSYLSSVESSQTSADGEASVILARFIGGVPGTETLKALLSDLAVDICRAYGRELPLEQETMKDVRRNFLAALRVGEVRRPLVIFLDGLDNIGQGAGAWRLDWLPKKWPPHLRIIASTRPGAFSRSAELRYPGSTTALPPMTVEEGGDLLDAWLREGTDIPAEGVHTLPVRKLTAAQRDSVLKTFAAGGKPLWLRLAAEKARQWASWDPPAKLPSTVEEMVRDFVDNAILVRGNHPKKFATRTLAYLTLGRMGLAEDELGRALATDEQVRQEFAAHIARTGQSWDVDANGVKLPPILWSRLFFDLRPFLSGVEAGGKHLLRWFHGEFKEGITGRCLPSGEDVTQARRHLAKALEDLAPAQPGRRPAGLQPAELRRIEEEGWQYRKAGDLAQAEGAARAALEMLERAADGEHTALLVETLNTLTSLLLAKRRVEPLVEAAGLQTKALGLLREPGIRGDLRWGSVMFRVGEISERGARLLQKRLAMQDAPAAAQARIDGLLAMSEQAYRKAFEVRTRLLGRDHASTRSARRRLEQLQTGPPAAH